MTSSMDNQKRDYTSSDHPVKSIHCKAILELGKKISKELGLNQSVDTLGRWMAHYIAELIEDAEKAVGEDRVAKKKICCQEILNIWQHRYALQHDKYPFKDLEPVIRALDSLDPDNDIPRYYRHVRESIDVIGEDNNVRRWIELANHLDYSAKILISFCLDQAAADALEKSAEWIKLAQEADAVDGVEFTILDKLDLISEPGDIVKKPIENRIDRLEKFAKLALEVAADWRSDI